MKTNKKHNLMPAKTAKPKPEKTDTIKKKNNKRQIRQSIKNNNAGYG